MQVRTGLRAGKVISDLAARFTHVTGLDDLAEKYTWDTGRDCRCEKRYQILDAVFP